MAENLYPENFSDVNQILPDDYADGSTYTGYKESAYFDFSTGDFVRDGVNQIITSTGTDAWIQWCIKCLSTPRYACFAYSTDFGIDVEAVFSTTNRAEAESVLTREITEALEADPYKRLSYIDSIEYSWSGYDEVEIKCTLVGIDGNTAETTTTLAKS